MDIGVLVSSETIGEVIEVGKSGDIADHEGNADDEAYQRHLRW